MNLEYKLIQVNTSETQLGFPSGSVFVPPYMAGNSSGATSSRMAVFHWLESWPNIWIFFFVRSSIKGNNTEYKIEKILGALMM